jgi:hypothetical protein
MMAMIFMPFLVDWRACCLAVAYLRACGRARTVTKRYYGERNRPDTPTVDTAKKINQTREHRTP